MSFYARVFILIILFFQRSDAERERLIGWLGETYRSEDFTKAPQQVPGGPVALLHKTVHMPLLGLGVGNMPPDRIPGAVTHAVELGVGAIDTAAASRNEHVISQALRSAHALNDVFVVTKVWYTHLGYERTKLSVQQSLQQLGKAPLDLVLVHWPRCRTDGSIRWMHCAEEEAALPEDVKQAGPAPHLVDQQGGEPSWHATWRALEDLYFEGKIKAIGVSNFEQSELQELLSLARVRPSVLQHNVWKVVFDPILMRFLREEGITFQAYAVSSVLARRRPCAAADLARSRIDQIATEIAATPAQLVLKWLVQQGVSVVPRAADPRHLEENARVTSLAALGAGQMSALSNAVEDLMRATNGLPPRARPHHSRLYI